LLNPAGVGFEETDQPAGGLHRAPGGLLVIRFSFWPRFRSTRARYRRGAR
jgi:hypothetical protein